MGKIALLASFFILLTGLLAGCSSAPDLPLKTDVTTIEVFAAPGQRTGAPPVTTISDTDRIQGILTRINQLPPSGFGDPEPESTLYEVHFHAKRKDTVFILARQTDGGKFYKKDSRRKREAWFIPKYLIEQLTGETATP